MISSEYMSGNGWSQSYFYLSPVVWLFSCEQVYDPCDDGVTAAIQRSRSRSARPGASASANADKMTRRREKRRRKAATVCLQRMRKHLRKRGGRRRRKGRLASL